MDCPICEEILFDLRAGFNYIKNYKYCCKCKKIFRVDEKITFKEV